MDQNRNQPQGQGNQVSTNARGSMQESKKAWDGHERRVGMSDRRHEAGQHQNRNTTADTRLMNEGSSR